ncbi:Formylmethionine deformylase [Nitrosomonas europaea ATCC 19718]|uniref:Peptide deformylase 2 n=2 Tax=Nitrosomonadaceae TaxID=206379 RepID=DEF2_NITEU|nr:RecName: Full=Peptide deformylase 2; Short=PDF 2; AltName: Full=Polypeptide deformylase 2 [Nitrosomonas europaea ATCC 19718]CAD85881.1 Formylmethionine deformylase [Nitrosomonas europaea ATCC 19718]
MIEPLPRILVSELCKFVMAILNILRYPDERLHKIATEVPSITREIRTLVSNMAETMYAAPGIGLAATQVDVHQRIIVIDVSETRDELLVLINPEIIASSGNAETQEGCLSVPGIFDKVTRAEEVTVRATGIDGKSFEMDASGLLAVCIQHEMDHLMGKVFVEYLSPFKQSRILSKLKKQARRQIA